MNAFHRSNSVAFFIPVLILLASLGQILRNMYYVLRERNFIDFMVYYQAAGAYLSGANPYHRLYVEKPGIPFNYPSGSLLFFSGFTFIPPVVTETMLLLISLLCLVIAMGVVLDCMHVRIRKSVLLVFLACAFQSFPVKFTLVLGQINLIVLGLTMMSLYAYGRGRLRKHDTRWLLGAVILFATAATLKLFPLYLLPLFVVLGDWVFVLSVTSVFIMLNMAPSVSLFAEYFTRILPSLATFGSPAFYDQSVIAMFVRLNPVSLRYVSVIGTGLFMTYAYLYIMFRKYMATDTSGLYRIRVLMFFGCLILAFASIAGSFSWQHHLVFSYPLITFVFFLEYARKQSRERRMSVIGFGILIWIAMAFHFRDETATLLRYPLVASYQTITVLVLIGGTIRMISRYMHDFIRTDMSV